MGRIKGANGELMKYSMQPMGGKGHLTLYRYDQLAVGGADNAHLEFWIEIEELRKQLADAQATIAALQARVQELEQWVQDQSTANLETMRHTDEMQSRAMEAEQQLTQRTAELEAANKHCEIIEERKAEAYKEVEIQLLAKANLQAELERVSLLSSHNERRFEEVDKKYKELRTLILTLPKVEGEIEVYTGKNTNQVVVTYNRGVIIGTLYGLDHAKPVAALYEHRQGMEG